MGAYVIGVEMSDERLALAQQLGAHAVVDAKREDPVLRVRELTRGQGRHRRRGDLRQQGRAGAAVRGDPAQGAPGVRRRSPGRRGDGPQSLRQLGPLGLRQVVGTVTYGIADWYQMAETLVLHGYKPGQLITHRFPIEQAQEAYDRDRVGQVRQGRLRVAGALIG